ncbi:cytochrome P450 [Nonomuraea wenchangensis]|uniref:Cytochrome P450 n=1 Tax=Nonomuraea wenchangensis TaxID=568860 RepID=A0A1I0LBE9_9ACTN|nr:cytochrome P450 [Nonomuraea wenchangensis]SEU37470.1 Cytochrome P450 [Nonomuraea wenchangensis]
MSEKKCPVLDIAKVNNAHGHVEAYATVREGGPVARSEDLGGYWALLGYTEVREGANDTERLCSGLGSTIPALGMTFRPIPVEVDPPHHRNYRKILVPELRPDRVADWTDLIRRKADEAIDTFIENGKGDLCAIARYMPPAVIAAILGVPEDGPLMVKLTDDINRAATENDAEGKKNANIALFRYVDQIVTAAEQSEDRADLLTFIAKAEIEGAPIGHDIAVAMTVTLVIAGQETTVNGIGGSLWRLGAHQDVKKRLIEDPSLIPAAVEESLRLESPVQMMGRTATSDFELQGVPISKGDRVGLAFGAANVDPAKFESPEKFDLDRTGNPHVAFGHGIHRCIGEHLARLEMRVAIEQVLTRMPDFALDGEIEIGSNIPINRGPKAVPVTFTPGSRVYA